MAAMAAGEPIRLVTTNNVDVYRLLGAPAVARLRVHYTVAADQAELVEAVERLRPRIALIDVELAGGSGYDACRQIKDNPALAQTHVVLLLSPRGRMSREVLDRIARSGCDDVMAMPLHPDDFYFHLAHLTGAPFRRDRRIGVDLEILLPISGSAVRAQVMNVSAGGVGIRTPHPLAIGEPVLARFHRSTQTSPETAMVVAWCQEVDASLAAGLRFDGEPTMKTRLLLEQIALFDIIAGPDQSTVLLHGDFTEMTTFQPLASRLVDAPRLDFDLGAVRYLSSAGVRSWCHFLASLGDKPYQFRHCSVAFATQAAMVPMVLGHGEVISLEAPYVCDTCDREDTRLLETQLILREGDRFIPPRLHCARCGGELTFDDVPERYFAFLRDD